MRLYVYGTWRKWKTSLNLYIEIQIYFCRISLLTNVWENSEKNPSLCQAFLEKTSVFYQNEWKFFYINTIEMQLIYLFAKILFVSLKHKFYFLVPCTYRYILMWTWISSVEVDFTRALLVTHGLCLLKTWINWFLIILYTWYFKIKNALRNKCK